jgi:tripartite-type tricarboxylate transporter receptor subunit TctC
MDMDRRDVVKGLGAGAFSLTAPVKGAFAQAAADYPKSPLHIYIGFPAGSGADILGRYFTNKLQEVSGKPVIVENRPGATSNIAVGLVAKAKPDGYSILFVANSNMAGSRYLFKDLPFDTVKDFTPAATFAQIVFCIVVAADSKFKTMADLTNFLKTTDRGKYGYTNQTALLSAELYKAMAGVKAEPVSYRTAPDVLPDVVNGTLEFSMMDGTYAAGQIRAGRIRALAVTTAQRSTSFPGVPTMQESGLPGFEFAPWWCAYFPKGTPQDIVDKFAGWLLQVVKMDETAKFLETVGAIPLAENGKQADARLMSDIEKWGPIVKAANIQPQ